MKAYRKIPMCLRPLPFLALAAFLGVNEGAQAQVIQQAVQPTVVYPIPQQIELGPTLDVIPNVLADGFTINLALIPTLTEFVGYETPPPAPAIPGVNVVQVPTVLPQFRARQVATTVNVWDGQTIALGGLISSDVQMTKDKVPMLGDIPLFGRFFRSESKIVRRKNLIIFVTPTIIDPAGNPLHKEEDMPFRQQTPIPPQPQPQRPAAPNNQ